MRVVPSVDPIHPTDVQIRCEYQYGFTDYSYAPDFTFNMVVSDSICTVSPNGRRDKSP